MVSGESSLMYSYRPSIFLHRAQNLVFNVLFYDIISHYWSAKLWSVCPIIID